MERPYLTPFFSFGYALHRVKEGETVYEIARKYRVYAETLIRANNLTEEPKTGSVLLIPLAGLTDADGEKEPF